MIRTQIYLPKSHIDWLSRQAKKNQQSKSEVLRSLISEKKDENAKPLTSFVSPFDVVEEFKKRGIGGPKDLAKNLDHYLYGTRKKK